MDKGYVFNVSNKDFINTVYQYENYHEKLLFLAAQSLTTGALEDDQIAFEQIINICRGAKQVS